MKTHLPYAFLPENEFHHPTEGWLLLERSVVFDSWISWRHVLPPGMRDCRQMSAAVNQAILSLAAALHEVHQRLPDYRSLGDSPFRVARWWDPSSEAPWNTGAACLFQVDGYTSDQFISFVPSRGACATLEPVSSVQIKAAVNPAPAAGVDTPRPDAEHRRVRGQPRKPPSPPPGTPDSGPPSGPIAP
jgi:hypothetical protein